MQFPRILVPQRLQTRLLLTAPVPICLIVFLAADLARDLRTVVISEPIRTV